MDCSLKIDGHQVLKPFNEQFLSIIQQFQTFQLDPSEVRDQWTFIMKMPPRRLTEDWSKRGDLSRQQELGSEFVDNKNYKIFYI